MAAKNERQQDAPEGETTRSVQKKTPEITDVMMKPDFVGEVRKAGGWNAAEAERFMRGVKTYILADTTGKLMNCTGVSIFRAVLSAAQLRIPIDFKGHGFLVPYKTKDGTMTASFQPGYKGWIAKARGSKTVRSIITEAVYKGDHFVVRKGDNPGIDHSPNIHGEHYGRQEAVTHFYAIAKLASGDVEFEVMTVAQVNEIRDRSKFVNPIWQSDWVEMGRKTCLRRLGKWLQIPELEELVVYEDRQDAERQEENVPDAPKANYLPKLKEAMKALKFSDSDLAKFIVKRFKKEPKELTPAEREQTAYILCKEAGISA